MTRHSTDRLYGGGVSLLYRFGTGNRVSAFAGAGISARWQQTTEVFDVRCEPRVAGGCDGVDVSSRTHVFTRSTIQPQIVSGIEVSASRFLTAFAAVRIDDGVTSYGGVRVAVTTRPGGASAPTVRVSDRHGRVQQGVLVSLAGSDVIIEQSGRRVVLPLVEVRHVEKITHRVRNLTIAGAILGYVGGYLASCGSGDENYCWRLGGRLFAGIGAATGAIIGSAISRRAAAAGRDVLYRAPPRSP